MKFSVLRNTGKRLAKICNMCGSASFNNAHMKNIYTAFTKEVFLGCFNLQFRLAVSYIYQTRAAKYV